MGSIQIIVACLLAYGALTWVLLRMGSGPSKTHIPNE
jgi:hypothetical protein